MTLLIVVLAIGMVAGLYVVLPIMAHAYERARGRWLVSCPDTDGVVDIEIDAKQAAKSAVTGRPTARVGGCARWPEHQDCDQGCLS
jgi:hypothetical protein